ncbi:MAG: hypothetical protein ACHQUC_09755 [Chlamydiales bacterium]
MKNIMSLLIVGLMTMSSTSCLAASHSSDSQSSLNTLTEASAIVSAEAPKTFPICGQAILDAFLVKSGDVSLCKGSLELPEGVYRVTYSTQLHNSGQVGVMELWLESMDSPCQGRRIVPNSRTQINVNQAGINGSTGLARVFREVIIKLKRPALISLNYSTKGKVHLSTLPAVTLPISGIATIPIPFTLNVIKIAER